jgi:hypothetical protein
VILTTGMAHPRKEIRHAVVALLTNATAADARVQGTRVEPHKKSQLPAISVYTLREPVDQDASAGTAPLELTRDVKVEITGWVAHSDELPVDDAMDDLAEEIEAAMDADRYLGGKAGDSILEETVMQVLEEDGRSDPLIGIVTLTYSVTYRTSPAAPSDLEDFLSVDAKHRIAGAVEANQARDQFVVQETTP